MRMRILAFVVAVALLTVFTMVDTAAAGPTENTPGVTIPDDAKGAGHTAGAAQSGMGKSSDGRSTANANIPGP